MGTSMKREREIAKTCEKWEKEGRQRCKIEVFRNGKGKYRKKGA